MRQRFVSFLVVWLLMFNGKIFGQETPLFVEKKITLPLYKMTGALGNIQPPKVSYETLVIEELEKHIPSLIAIDCGSGKLIITPLRLPLYKSTIGMMCKAELVLDKIIKVPLRFRLGSLDYVNWMERKPNAVAY